MKEHILRELQERASFDRERVGQLRGIILESVGVTECFPPSVVLAACLDIAAFAAVGINVSRKDFLQAAENIYKHTKVPIEACMAMKKHEAEVIANKTVGERRRCVTCKWIGSLEETLRTDGCTSSCPKCHGWALEDPDNPNKDKLAQGN